MNAKRLIIFFILVVGNISCVEDTNKLTNSTPEIVTLNSFGYTPSTLVYESGKFYNMDSVEVDSIKLSASFSSSGTYYINLKNSNTNLVKTDTLYIASIALSDIFLGSAPTVGNNNFSVKMLDTLEDSLAIQTITLNILDKYQEPYYRYCWHLDNSDLNFHTSQNIDTAAGIHIKEAWDISRGAGVLVAVIDDYFDKSHEDLNENISEVYSVITLDTTVKNPTSSSSHGLTCASFIAAPENRIGVVGVAPEAKLLLISEGTNSTDFQTLKAFDYAVSKGAKVISCSWGTYQVSGALTAKLQEMNDSGITVVFANGNDSYDLDGDYNDESELSSVLGIGASAEDNDYTSYTNYGSNIEVLAPGGEVLGVLGADDMGANGSKWQLNFVNNNYAFTTGTSFSAPITAGIVALMLGANPSLTPDQIRTILIETADKVGGKSANYVDGFDKYRAYGKVNATEAVKRAAGL